MALLLAFKANLDGTGKKITIKDTTGVYDSSTNTGGWGSPNIAATDVATVKLDITYSDGTVQTANLTGMPASITEAFSYNAITLSGYKDGIAKLSYKVTTTDATPVVYVEEISQLYSCDIRKCINQMWVKIACETCNGNCDLVNLIDDANLAEGLYRALISGATCCDSTCINKILTALNNICSWKNCNC
jgi:hypothetical protein